MTTQIDWFRERLALEPSRDPFHVEDPAVQRRRQVVVIVTAVVGAVLTGFALNAHGTGLAFFGLTFGLAGTWIVGAIVSGPLHLGRWHGRRDLLRPTVLAVAAFLVFLVGDLIVRQVPYLHHQIQNIIGHASGDALALAIVVAAVNGIGEELFFRGAVYSAFGPRRPLVASTVVYLAVIACAGTPILLVAGVIMGTVFALERQATRGILASSITHIVWSMLMIGLLPR